MSWAHLCRKICFSEVPKTNAKVVDPLTGQIGFFKELVYEEAMESVKGYRIDIRDSDGALHLETREFHTIQMPLVRPSVKCKNLLKEMEVYRQAIEN